MEEIFNEWVALVASIATLVSLAVNVFQWRRNLNLISLLKARSEAAFNIYREIAYQTNLMF